MSAEAEVEELVLPDILGDPAPVQATAVEALERQLDHLDLEIIRLVRRRTELARRVTCARVNGGGTGYVHQGELAVVRRYLQLGRPGRDLALVLLRLGRVSRVAGSTAGAGTRPVDPSVP